MLIRAYMDAASIYYSIYSMYYIVVVYKCAGNNSAGVAVVVY